jgi:DNA polymerase-3 subunit gamma/tau
VSYLAIARKYRPATFDEMVGQRHVTQTLANAIRSGRIHHAFLFCGARGVGKTTAARALARALNCAEGPTPTPCGTCSACREILAGASPDMIEIDGASNNGVDDIRELRETVHYAPTRGKYRIYLIDEVHMLSKAAFNALLKTLEEPPPHVVFLFATTEAEKIPETILSRVQRFDFQRIPAVGVAERLREIAEREGATVSPAGLRQIARAGGGSMRDAQSLLDKVISFAGADLVITDSQVAEALGLVDRGLLHALLSALVRNEPVAALETVQRAVEAGYDLTQLSAELLELVRDVTFLVLAPSLDRHVELPTEEIAQLRALATDVDPEVLSRLFAALLDVHDQVARSARPRLVLEMAVARLATLRPAQPVAALLGRLEALERRLRQGGPRPPEVATRGEAASPAPARPTERPVAPQRPAPGRVVAPPPDTEGPPRAQADGPNRPDVDIPPPTPEPTAEDAAPRRAAWRHLVEELRRVGGPALSLADGEPRWTEAGLTVILEAGRPLAEARRSLRMPAVDEAIRRHLGPAARIDAVARAGTGTTTDAQRALERVVREDPRVARLIHLLGATLDRVRPDDTEEP